MYEAKSTMEEWENFYNSTTLHGFRFVFTPGAKGRRIVWLIIVITSLVGVTYQLIKSIEKYHTHPTATDIQEMYPNTISFPALSICYRSPILLNKLTKHAYFNAYLLARNKTQWTPSLVLKFLEEQSKEGRYRDLMKELSQDDKWFIRSTKFSGKSYHLEDYQFVLHGTENFCYTFNNNASTLLHTVSDTTGSDKGFSVILKVCYVAYYLLLVKTKTLCSEGSDKFLNKLRFTINCGKHCLSHRILANNVTFRKLVPTNFPGPTSLNAFSQLCIS